MEVANLPDSNEESMTTYSRNMREEMRRSYPHPITEREHQIVDYLFEARTHTDGAMLVAYKHTPGVDGDILFLLRSAKEAIWAAEDVIYNWYIAEKAEKEKIDAANNNNSSKN